MKTYLFLFVFCFVACNTDTDRQVTDNTLSIEKNQLLGVWTTGKWELYHSLHFEDRSLVISHHIDTIEQHHYTINENRLHLIDWRKDTLTVEIAEISDTHLIIKGFLPDQKSKRYSR